MKSALVVAAFVATFAIAVPVAHMLRDTFGPASMAMLTLAFAFSAAWLGHSPETAAWAEDFCEALKMAGISQKAAAIAMGVPEPTLSNWISGKEQGSWRIAKLGPKFRVAFGKLLIARDSDATVVERQELCDLVNAVQLLTAERRRPVLVQNMNRSEVA